MGVLLLHPRFVEVLFPIKVHQIELVDESAFLQHFQRTVDRHSIDFRVFFFREVKEALGIQMLCRFINQLQQDLALPRQPDSLFLQGLFDS